MNKTIRALVFARACNRCEVPGCTNEALHFDHHFGRAKAAETVENGWAHCLTHSEAKTSSRPSAAYWQLMFVEHCDTQIGKIASGRQKVGTWAGYVAARERAQTKLAVLRVKGHA